MRVALSPSLVARRPSDKPLKPGPPHDNRSRASPAQKSQSHPGLTPPTFPALATGAHGPRLQALAAVVQGEPRIKHDKVVSLPAGNPISEMRDIIHGLGMLARKTTGSRFSSAFPTWDGKLEGNRQTMSLPANAHLWLKMRIILFLAISPRSLLALEGFSLLRDEENRASKQIFLPELCLL